MSEPAPRAVPKKKVIEVEGVISHYDGRAILKGVSMDVREGEIMVVMGGSGSGKSTLLRHLMALEQPSGGRIRILGHDLATLDGMGLVALRKRMGVAFQGGALFSSMTVGENIMLPLYEHTDLDRMTMEIMVRMKLEVVNLAGYEGLMPSQLSGGMVKRAAMARAMIMDPTILFCDEPSAGLDPIVADALDDLILRMRDATGVSVVVVTHELDSAMKIADRVTVLDRGEILFMGTVPELQASPNKRIQNMLQRRAITAEIDPHEYLDRLTGETPNDEVRP